MQGADDAPQGAINDAYRTMRAYWYPQRAAAEITYGGTKSDGGRVFDAVRIVPKGGRPFELWIDGKTHLFDRTIEQMSNQVQTTFFSDYRAVAGRMIPFVARSTT